MRRLLGPHLGGQWANKIELLRQWQPRLILVLQPEVDKVKQLRDACPGAIIIGRFFHDDSHYASNINARPKEFAREIHQEIANNPVTPLLDYAQSNNETNQDWQGIQKLNEYTQEWMHLADQSQVYKCAILTFSVGNPDLPNKPGDSAGFDGRMLYWQQVLPTLNYAQANDHILLLHAYGYPNMFAPNADWYLYRYERQVQASLRTLGITNLKYAYGEIGIDRLIVNGKGGYKVVTNDQDYTNQLLQWERDQQGQSLLLGGAIFTFGDSGGWGSYDITSTNVASMIATHYADHAGDYNTPDSPDNGGHTVFIPAAGTGQPAQSTLPERQWDERLTQRGVTIETPALAPGQQFWRIVKAQWWNEQESQGRHHIYVEAIANGKSMDGVEFEAFWPDGHAFGKTNGKSGFDAGNFPMSKSLNEFGVGIDTEYPTETLKGIGMGADGNSGIHTSTGVVFQLVTMPAATTPTQPTPQPTNTLAYVIAKAGANLRTKPNTQSAIIVAVAYAEPIRITGVTDTSGWLRVRWGDFEGYMASSLVGLVAPEPLPVPPEGPVPVPSGDKWERSIAWVLKREGGYSDNPEDHGNWTGGRKGQGELKGTNWGISAASYPTLDIRNLSKAQAISIYERDYWQRSGANLLAWPLCLLVLDSAILHGVGASTSWLNEVGPNPYAFASKRLRVYTKSDNGDTFWRGWVNRVSDLLEEMGK